MSRALLLSIYVCAAALPAAAQGPDAFLPEAYGRFQAIRYDPTEPDLHWSGWIGGGLALARLAGTTFTVQADVETLIGNRRRAFDASQANYHLEANLRRPIGSFELEPFYHHVSRHLSDRAKEQAVDWNILGARLSRRFEGAPLPLWVSIGAGYVTQESLVGYRWEFTGRARAEVVARPWGGVYADLNLRAVNAEASPRFPRDSFVDHRLEAGLRFARGARRIETYAAFERRNDVRLEEPGARSRLLLGLRLAFDESGRP